MFWIKSLSWLQAQYRNHEDIVTSSFCWVLVLRPQGMRHMDKDKWLKQKIFIEQDTEAVVTLIIPMRYCGWRGQVQDSSCISQMRGYISLVHIYKRIRCKTLTNRKLPSLWPILHRGSWHSVAWAPALHGLFENKVAPWGRYRSFYICCQVIKDPSLLEH